jgi:hypothetical protein
VEESSGLGWRRVRFEVRSSIRLTFLARVRDHGRMPSLAISCFTGGWEAG